MKLRLGYSKRFRKPPGLFPNHNTCYLLAITESPGGINIARHIYGVPLTGSEYEHFYRGTRVKLLDLKRNSLTINRTPNV